MQVLTVGGAMIDTIGAPRSRSGRLYFSRRGGGLAAMP
jgi:hypothetical protein